MISLIRERALTHFADMASVYHRSLRHVWVVSPWITTSESFYALNVLMNVIERSHALLTVVTRRPEKPNHQAAFNAIMSLPQAEIFLIRHLHAKLYLLECDGLRGALIGSANFTLEGDSELVEVVADVRTSRESDDAAQFTKDLLEFARDLTIHRDVECAKNLASGWWRGERT